jgi:hypothetical protein
MRGTTRLISILVFVSLAGTGSVQAQTVPGQYGPKPYISHAEFQNIRLNGPGGTVRMGEILSITSVDEANKHLGKPDSIDIKNIGAGSYERSIRLVYEGMEIRYMDYSDPVDEVRLINLDIDSSSYSIEVAGKEILTGMSSHQLSRNVRKNKAEDESSQTTSLLIRVSEGSAEDGGSASEIAEHEAISIEVDDRTGEVVRIRYHTMV